MTEQERCERIKGIREMADFLEWNPDVPIPWVNEYASVDTKERMQAVARCGKWQKGYASDSMSLIKRFSGSVTLNVYVDREKVCTKRQVGTVKIEARPAEPEREEPVYEWVCEAILAPENTEEPSNA